MRTLRQILRKSLRCVRCVACVTLETGLYATVQLCKTQRMCDVCDLSNSSRTTRFIRRSTFTCTRTLQVDRQPDVCGKYSSLFTVNGSNDAMQLNNEKKQQQRNAIGRQYTHNSLVNELFTINAVVHCDTGVTHLVTHLAWPY